jgi:S1-C subfamily serine protease
MNMQHAKKEHPRAIDPSREVVPSPTSALLARRLLTGLLMAGLGLCAVPARAQDMKPETLENVKSATVMVWNRASRSSEGDTPLGSGSGYFINGSGLVITNNHVVDPGHGKSLREKWALQLQYNLLVVTVVTDSGTDAEVEWKCKLLYQNEQADQALLQVYDEKFVPAKRRGSDEEQEPETNEEPPKLEWPHYLRFLPESQLEERLKVIALGFPGGDSRKGSGDKHPIINVVEGHVLEIPRTPSGRVEMIFTDAEIRQGNSGGPMVNVDGLLVGTNTLGFGSERRNLNALVPAALTGKFVRAAFELGKVPGGTDYTPFMEMLTGDDGQMNIPEFARLKERDVLFYEGGERYYGDIATDSILWKSALGDLNVPTSAIAYVMNNDEGSHLFMEGGNRIASSDLEASFEFTPVGGSKVTQEFDDVRTIAFRTSDRQVEERMGKILVLDTELTHLRLADIEGEAEFQGRFPIKIKLDDIEVIDTNEDDEQVLVLRDGRLMTGRFDEAKFKAVIADTGMPIEFGLDTVSKARFHFETYRPNTLQGLGIAEVLHSAGRNVSKILETLINERDPDSAWSQVNELLKSDDFKKMPNIKKEQARLLAAEAALRNGNTQDTPKLFRKCLRAEDENIRAYANACYAVLKRHPDFEYEGKPFTDRATFITAGTVIADEYIQQARDILKDGELFEGERRAEYVGGIGDVKKNEDLLRSATVFRGTDAEDELFRLWRFAVSVADAEIRRINREIEEKRGQRGKSRGRGKGARQARQRELDELNEHLEEAQETRQAYETKLRWAGFRIEDPDIQKQKEREAEQEPDKEPEPDEGEEP